MLLLAALLLPAYVGSPGICVRTPPLRAPLAVCKLNKQQELARMMELAKLQKEGLVPDNAEAAPKPKPKPIPKAKPKQSREQLFAAMQRMKEQAGGDQLTSQTGAQKYGGKKSSAANKRPAPMPSTAALRDASASAKAMAEREAAKRRAMEAQYSYDEFSSLMKGSGKSGRVSRALSDEKLPRGSDFPVPAPSRFRDLDGVPNSYASLDAIAEGRRTLVVLATMDTFMSESLRSTLLAVSGTVPVAQLDASVVCVSRAAPSAYRKLARKANVNFALLSDADSTWLPLLKAEAGQGEIASDCF